VFLNTNLRNPTMPTPTPARRAAIRLLVPLSALVVSSCNRGLVSEQQATGRVLLDSRPYGLAVSRSGDLFVSQLDGRSVTRYQVGASASSGVVPVGETPTDVTFDPTGSLAFVTNQLDPSVGIIDVGRSRQTQLIPTSASTFRVLVAPNGRRAYATQTDGYLLVIDVATRAATALVPIARPANGLAFGVGDTLLYVTSMSGDVSVVDVRTNAVVRTWELGGTLQDVVVSPDGRTLYVAHEDSKNAIDVVDASTGIVSARFVLGAGAFGLALAPDKHSLYATEPSLGLVAVVDLTSGRISRTFTVGGIPRRIGFDRSTGRALVSNEAGWIDYLP
jgi:DNA-binding beta-propeller fold protein YncE